MLLFLVDLINIEKFRISFRFFYSFSFIFRSRATSVWYQSITLIRDQAIPLLVLIRDHFDPSSAEPFILRSRAISAYQHEYDPFIKRVRRVNTNMIQTQLYSIQTHKNRVGFVSCLCVGSNFINPT